MTPSPLCDRTYFCGFRIEIGLEFFARQIALCAAAWNLDPGAPQDRVHHHPSEVEDAPVAVKVPAAGAEAPTAVGALDRQA
jgi:hypothetical protein